MRWACHQAPAARGCASAPLAAGAWQAPGAGSLPRSTGTGLPEQDRQEPAMPGQSSIPTIEAVARYVQAIGGAIQISAVFGGDHYLLRGTVTEAA